MTDDTKMTASDLEKEAKKLFNFIGGKKIDKIYRHRTQELGIVFSDGMILFIDAKTDLEFSIN